MGAKLCRDMRTTKNHMDADDQYDMNIILHSLYIILKLMTKILKGWAAAGFVPNAILHMVKSRFKQDIICDISDHMHHVQILTAIW